MISNVNMFDDYLLVQILLIFVYHHLGNRCKSKYKISILLSPKHGIILQNISKYFFLAILIISLWNYVLNDGFWICSSLYILDFTNIYLTFWQHPVNYLYHSIYPMFGPHFNSLMVAIATNWHLFILCNSFLMF